MNGSISEWLPAGAVGAAVRTARVTLYIHRFSIQIGQCGLHLCVLLWPRGAVWAGKCRIAAFGGGARAGAELTVVPPGPRGRALLGSSLGSSLRGGGGAVVQQGGGK